MSERHKQISFLKKLAQYEQDETLHRLQDRIARAEREEKCVRTAVTLVALIGLASAFGLGYSVVVLEDVFRDSAPTFIRIFSIIGLGSLLCLVGYLGYWQWRRALTNRLYEDTRTHLLCLSETRLWQRGDTSPSDAASSSPTNQEDPGLAQAA